MSNPVSSGSQGNINEELEKIRTSNWEYVDKGTEAEVFKKDIDEVPGPWENKIKLPDKFPVAMRVSYQRPLDETFGSNLLFKQQYFVLVEKIFRKIGKYEERHISIPIGSFNNGKICGHYYLFVEGEDYLDIDVPIWNERSEVQSAYRKIGIDIDRDLVDDAGNIKNIIFQGKPIEEGPWKRIDFGTRSINFYPEMADSYATENKKFIKEKFGGDMLRILHLSAALSHVNLAHLKIKITKELGKKLGVKPREIRSKGLERPEYILSTEKIPGLGEEAAEEFREEVKNYLGNDGAEALLYITGNSRLRKEPEILELNRNYLQEEAVQYLEEEGLEIY